MMRVYLLFAVLGISWGSLWLVTGGSVDPVPLLCEGAVRLGVAALLLGIYGWVRRDDEGSGGKFSYISGAVLGLALLGIPYACTAWASGTVHPYLRSAASGLPAVFYGALPMAVMLMWGADAGRYLPRLLFGLTGVALLVAQGAALDLARWLPELVLAVGMLIYGFGLVYGAKRLRVERAGVGSLSILHWCALQCATAAVGLAVMAAANGDWGRLVARFAGIEAGRWFGIALAAGITGVTLPFMYLLLEIAGPISTAALQWLITLTVVLESEAFVPVAWEWQNWAGLLMTAVALWWVLKPEQESGSMFLSR